VAAALACSSPYAGRRPGLVVDWCDAGRRPLRRCVRSKAFCKIMQKDPLTWHFITPAHCASTQAPHAADGRRDHHRRRREPGLRSM